MSIEAEANPNLAKYLAPSADKASSKTRKKNPKVNGQPKTPIISPASPAITSQAPVVDIDILHLDLTPPEISEHSAEGIEPSPSPEELTEIEASGVITETGEAPEDPNFLPQTALDAYYVDLRRVSKRLLTADEELSLGRTVQAGIAARAELIRSPEIEQQKKAELEKTAQAGTAAHHRMIEMNLKLVIDVARGYMGRGLPLEDLIQEGNLGLHHAVEKFDPGKGWRFSTYAYWWVRQKVTKALNDQIRTIRIPGQTEEFAKKIRETGRRLEQELGREVTTEDLAAEMKVPVDRIREVIRATRIPASLTAVYGPDQDGSLGDAVEDEHQTQQLRDLEVRLDRKSLEEAIDSLGNIREIVILRLRFGFDGDREHTLEEIGKEFGVTRERIRQVEKEALKKLRSKLDSAG